MTETETAAPVAAAALAAALAAVQAELPEIKKTRTAKVEKDGRLLYTYDYADLADVSLAILPILGKHGLAFTAFPGHEPNGKFGLRYQLLHEEGASIAGFYELAEQGGMQVTGGRITYARRYCLCAVTGVAAEDDVDANGSGADHHQQSRTAQRKQRAQTSPAPAAARPGAVPPSAERAGEGPPLPGEEDAPGPAPQGQPAGNEPAAGPGAPEPHTSKQLTAIWTVLSEVFLFGKDERDEARQVCAHIVNRELSSSRDLTKQEAATVLDTLAHWEAQAQREGETPRAYLQMMINATRGEDGTGE